MAQQSHFLCVAQYSFSDASARFGRSQLGRLPAYSAGSRSIARHDAARPSPRYGAGLGPFGLRSLPRGDAGPDDQFASWNLVSLLTALKSRYGRVADLERPRDRCHMLAGLLALASFKALTWVEL